MAYLDYEYGEHKVKGVIIYGAGLVCLIINLILLIIALTNLTLYNAPLDKDNIIFLGIGIVFGVVGLILLIIFHIKFKEKGPPPLPPDRKEKRSKIIIIPP